MQGNGAPPAGTGRPFLLRADDMVGGVILLFCAAVFAITTTFDEVPAMLSQGIPPTQFPRLLVGVIAFLVVVMMIQARRREAVEMKRVPTVAFATVGFLALFVAAIDWIGTFAAIFLFCLALPVLWGERRYAWIVVFAVLLPISIYILFSKVLGVRFPAGFFESFTG